TSVVLPWSTWAMIAILRRFSIIRLKRSRRWKLAIAFGPGGPVWAPACVRRDNGAHGDAGRAGARGSQRSGESRRDCGSRQQARPGKSRRAAANRVIHENAPIIRDCRLLG